MKPVFKIAPIPKNIWIVGGGLLVLFMVSLIAGALFNSQPDQNTIPLTSPSPTVIGPKVTDAQKDRRTQEASTVSDDDSFEAARKDAWANVDVSCTQLLPKTFQDYQDEALKARAILWLAAARAEGKEALPYLTQQLKGYTTQLQKLIAKQNGVKIDAASISEFRELSGTLLEILKALELLGQINASAPSPGIVGDRLVERSDDCIQQLKDYQDLTVQAANQRSRIPATSGYEDSDDVGARPNGNDSQSKEKTP